ncbi:PAS domain S-box protein [Geomesophilobacter sediminis]|uniref:Oxygen sensor histidine kinase NreB n=1 Tax=Geomesophilobacter sediminis TaxID=2798584 RepID=A0A8J7M287_9BACT|nr:PAS domain S-box protein [Geomesophilobacter sediminis]MBJ6727388.1 PAS domain S-box protein [Geomesophilobacter sediminis]
MLPEPAVSKHTFDQLVDLAQVRRLLQLHTRLSGLACGLLDETGNLILGVGFEEVCTRFHWSNPESFARCWRGDPQTRETLRSFAGEVFESTCKNGMVNIAMPIVIEGKRLALFFAGQFFYEDSSPDLARFRREAERFGFDTEAYLAALQRVPLLSRSHVADTVRFLHQLVQLMAEAGHANLMRVRDHEQRQQIERELFILTEAVNRSADPFLVIDQTHRFAYVNDAACRSLGYRREELLTMSPPDINPDVTHAMVEKVLTSTPDGGYAGMLESRHRTRDGRIFPVELSSSIFIYGGGKYLLTVARDISERREAQQLITLMSAALDKVREAAFLIDEEGNFVYVNQEACRSLGYEKEQLLRLGVCDIDPDYSPEVRAQAYTDLMKMGTRRFETRHCARSGAVFPVEITSTLFEFGATRYILSLARDITERKRLETSLRESEAKFRTVAENIPVNISRYDRQGRTLYINPNLERTLGLSLDEVYGKSPRELGHAAVYPEFVAALERVLASARSELLDMSFVEGDEEIHHQIKFVPERDPKGELSSVLAMGTDVTDLNRSSKQLLDQQKKLSDMALELSLAEERERRRIATDLHDTLGQDLTLARIKLGALPREGLSGNQGAELATIQGLLETAIGRVRRLTHLIAPPILESAGLEAALKWLARQLEKDYGLKIEFQDDNRKKDIRREAQMEVYNSVRELLINVAKHAGTKTARLSVGLVEERFAVTVADDGVGFAAARAANGTASDGFGLFNVRRRILHLGGSFQIDSAPGGGTRVSIRMPLAAQTNQGLQPESQGRGT